MEEEKDFAYCSHCLEAQYFILKGNILVCEECGKPLQYAVSRGTIVTRKAGKHDKPSWRPNLPEMQSPNPT